MMPHPSFTYAARLNRIIDADTLVLDVDLGFHVWITVHVRVRGVDAPELHTDAGDAAKAAVVKFFESQPAIVVATYRDVRSFERWVADVYLNGDLFATWLKTHGFEKKGA